jgi:nucleotide sugar dehydrogenase
MVVATTDSATHTSSSLPTYRICVVGLGKIGLALAAQYLAKGHSVYGADINAELVTLVKAGQVPANSEDGLEERIRAGFERGALRATTNSTDAVRESNVVVVIVPLLVDVNGVPEFRALDSATSAVAQGLQPGTLVIYETTLPLGTTRERFAPMLEKSGLRAGVDFQVAFSPERVYVGRTFEDLQKYPKVVGGITPEATDAAVSFYRSVLDAEIRSVVDAETAEFVKLAETTYRDVNIGLANDLARFAQSRGIDAIAAFESANTQPFSHLHTPGIGVGGHCIPVYPRFLLAQAGADELGIVRTARAVNDDMAEFAVRQIEAELGDLRGRRVLILGLAYRGGVKEASCSSALLVIPALRARGAVPLLHDPLFSDDELRATGAEPAHFERGIDIDAAILQADHREYLSLDWTLLRGCRIVVDGRNVLNREAIESPDRRFVAIGRGRGAHA